MVVFATASQAEIWRCGGTGGVAPEYVNNAKEAEIRGCTRLTAASPDGNLWKHVARNAKRSTEVYVIRRPVLGEGKFLKTWFLWSYSEPRTLRDGTAYQSTKDLSLFDCKSKRFAIRQIIYYTDTVAEGNVVRSNSMSDGELEFDDPSPGSVGEAVLDQACGNSKP